MASATILPGSGIASTGDWGSRSPTGVYLLADQATELVVDTIGAALAIAPPPGRTLAYATDPASTRYLALPPGDGSGGRTRAYWTQTTAGQRYWTFTPPTESTSYRISIFVTNGATGRPLDVTVLTADGLTTLVPTVTYTDSMPAVWVDIQATGSIRVQFGNTNFARFQGVLYSPVSSSTAHAEAAAAGLAIGGDWPPSLAIARAAWAGLEYGVGSGLDPSTTLVEDAAAGLAIGGDWPPSLAGSWDARAGIELRGEVVISLGSDPATLREAVYHRLKTSSALAAVVGSRITHGRVPQRSELPAVVFAIPARDHGHNLGGSDGTATATVRVDCWAARPDHAEAMAEAVRMAFQGFRGDVGRVEFLRCLLDDVGETVERADTGKDDWTHRHILTIDATHRVAKPTF